MTDLTPDPDATPVSGAADDAQTPEQAPAAPPEEAALDSLADLTKAVESIGDSLASEVAAFAAEQTSWLPEEYVRGGNFGGGAAKLADSAVAPLVAAARGYRTYDEESLDDVASLFGLGNRRSRQGKRLLAAILRRDALLMPWYVYDEVANPATAMRTTPLAPTSLQYRPSVLSNYVEEGEKPPPKYEFITGHDTCIGAHPATPHDWLTSAPVTLIAEGLLKADSALTGYLLARGFSRDDLAFDGTFDARARLRAMLESIPQGERVAVLSIAGVWNWRKNPEWNSMTFADRDVWLGIDGDVTTNPQVWKAASAIWEMLEQKKKARTSLLSPTVDALGEDGKPEKVGIDDFLSRYGTWGDLVKMLADRMPPAPIDVNLVDGDVRVDPNGCSVSRYKVQRDAVGQPIGSTWEKVVPIGGRIRSMLADRVPTPEEVATGRIDKGASPLDADEEVEVEVSFVGPDGEAVTHVVQGPARILNYLPEQWESKGAAIPADVMAHPKWPPRGKDGEAWLEAIKGHRVAEKVSRIRWASMGWVPTESGLPAFIAGEQIIGGDEDAQAEVLPGVGNTELERASSFGVGLHHDDGLSFGDAEYRARVKTAIESTLRHYVLNAPWQDRRNAAVVVAAGLRPALPVRPRAIPYFVGARGTGKSWSAEAVLGFWMSRPGAFDGSIPGSANDTAANMEIAVSRALLWIIDDLAPASSRRKSEDEKDKLGTLIRNVFNGTARGRSNASMESRKKLTPRALLVVTAENEPTISSEKDRVLLCNMGHGSLSPSSLPTNRLNDLNNNPKYPDAGAPAQVTQALVKFLRWLPGNRPGVTSWSDVYTSVVQQAEAFALEMAEADIVDAKMGTKRHAVIAADLLMPLVLLAEVARVVDCEDWVADLLSMHDSLLSDVISLVAEGAKANKETSPGRATMEALAAILRSGKAHIVLSDDGHSCPVDTTREPQKAAALGWVSQDAGQTWRPAQGSTPVGYLVYKVDPDTRERVPVVIFDPKVAFQVAYEKTNIIPHGSTEAMAWASCTGEGFGRADMLRKEGGKHINRCRVMSNGVTRSGYPVNLDQVLRGGSLSHEVRDVDTLHEEGEEG